eukprot:TRINITY_DN1794_c0_g2_i2.p1 TRINITY_DN1794_c0_g2~~TRINITY_DN1794_c0_g2_i2.p1  ORF type:complete len:856 (+),score=170.75 TRINITY_DN1794_c0_g2_i2:152-2569(+)
MHGSLNMNDWIEGRKDVFSQIVKKSRDSMRVPSINFKQPFNLKNYDGLGYDTDEVSDAEPKFDRINLKMEVKRRSINISDVPLAGEDYIKKRRRKSIKSIMRNIRKSKKDNFSSSTPPLPIYSKSLKWTPTITLMGTERCGKSSLIHRYFHQEFEVDGLPPTDRKIMYILPKVNEIDREIQVVDTPANILAKDSKIKTALDRPGIFGFVFDITNVTSFNTVRDLIKKHICDEMFILVGTYYDRRQYRRVKMKQINSIIGKYGCRYFEVSSKTGVGINELFAEFRYFALNNNIMKGESVRNVRKARGKKSRSLSPSSKRASKELAKSGYCTSEEDSAELSYTSGEEHDFFTVRYPIRKNEDLQRSTLSIKKSKKKNKLDLYPYFEEKDTVTWGTKSGRKLVLTAPPDDLIQIMCFTLDTKFQQDMLLTYRNILEPTVLLSRITEIYFQITGEDEEQLKANVLNILISWMRIDNILLSNNEFHVIMTKFMEVLQNNDSLDKEIIIDFCCFIEKGVEPPEFNYHDDLNLERSLEKSPNPILPRNLHSSSFGVLDINAEEIARQYTLLDHMTYCKVHHTELHDQNWTNPDTSPNLSLLIESFNERSNWVSACIVSQENVEIRMKILEKFISIAKHLFDMKNFHSLLAVLSGLQNIAVTRLVQTWMMLPSKYFKILEKLEEHTSIRNNFIRMKKYWKQSKGPLMPYIGVFLADLTFIEEVPTYKDNGINFDKMRMIAKILRRFGCFRTKYNFIQVEFIEQFLSQDLLQMEEDEMYEHSIAMETREKNYKIKEDIDDGKYKVPSYIVKNLL